MTNKAAFIVSLDLELYWGWRDIRDLDSCREWLLQVRPTVARILELFDRYQIHATWAAVGFLFLRNREELLKVMPRVKPDYELRQLSPYEAMAQVGRDEEADPYHYGPSILRAILNTPNQEVGTHTFSHYYCLEQGQTETAFRSDLEAAIRAAAEWGLELKSLVFPRNQSNPEYVDACRAVGIHSYRGAGRHWIYQGRKRRDECWVRRAVRLLDAYANVSGHHTVSFDEVRQGPPFNLPASRFLRPYFPALKVLEGLKLRRICSGLDYAARKRRIYHLWFHPEDLATNAAENLAGLETVLRRFAQLRDEGLMESVNMGELSERLLAEIPHTAPALDWHMNAIEVSR